MYINLANIDFGGEGGGKAVLQETTIESLLTETTKVVTPPEGVDGFNKVTVTHAPVETLTEATITSNGETTITPSAGFDATFGVKVRVDVPTTDVSANYRYKQPVADDTGLKAIGWDDDSINYFKYNNYVYPWDANNYKVSDANKQIVITKENQVAQYKDNPDFQYCPFFDTTGATSMNVTFYECSNLISIPRLNTSKVKLMNYTFGGCHSLSSIPPLDTSNVSDMGHMFEGCNIISSIPQLNTSNVTSMQSMFRECYSLSSIPQLDTSKVTNMDQMFQKCSSLSSIPQLDTSKVTSMYQMFLGCLDLSSIPQLDTSKVTNMNSMFFECAFITTIPRLSAASLNNAQTMFGYSFSKLSKFTDFGGLTGLKVDLDLTPCQNLTHDSLLNVINEAADVTSSPKTLTLGATNLAKLTDEEKAIATSKGWTLA